MKQIAIGIDIGGTNTVLGLVDQNGNVLAKDYFSTAKYNDITEYTNKLSGNINNLLQTDEVNLHIIGIGIGALRQFCPVFLFLVSLQKEEYIECCFHNLKLNYKVKLNKFLMRVMRTANV